MTLNNANFAAASWTPYTSSNITANLGATEGWHTVWVGLRGLPANAQQTWNAVTLDLDLTPPTLVVTNATNVTIPLLQLQGYANEDFARLTFDLANSNGTLSDQTGFLTGAIFDTNSFSYTNVAFKYFDLALAQHLPRPFSAGNWGWTAGDCSSTLGSWRKSKAPRAPVKTC